MPISGSQFEKGDLPPGPPVLLFLRRDEDQAYTVTEIVEGMRSDGVEVTSEVVRAVVSNLIEARVVEGKIVGGQAYYRARYDPRAGRAGG